jgi:hypothetical protein
LTAREARRRAMREFGNVTYATEERRIASGVAVFDALRQDVQFVFRVLRRRPTFAVVTVATLALGVGAATSIFSIADVVLFRPLAFPDPGRLIAVSQTQPELKTHPIRSRNGTKSDSRFPDFATGVRFKHPSTIWRSGITARASSVALRLPKKSESSMRALRCSRYSVCGLSSDAALREMKTNSVECPWRS